MKNMQVIEAFSRLKSLRENIPTHDVPTKFITEFHSILDILEQTSGGDLKNFRIPANEVRPIVTSWNYLTGEKKFSSENFCDHAYFKMKVDSVLMMFDILLTPSSDNKPPIGFNPNTK
ncbi:MAG: hypothetical protein FJ134_04095 [Deltaproteobacteria bacterium]|nr:hypothetical protein [Deltaproteobacteria bacterium]